MRDTEALQLALGVVPPWLVARVCSDADAQRLDIDIDFAKGARFACPNLGAVERSAYDAEAVVMVRVQAMPVNPVARLLGEGTPDAPLEPAGHPDGA